MLNVEKKLFATLSVVGLVSFVGQSANDYYLQSEMVRLHKEFSAEERALFLPVVETANRQEEDEFDGEPIRLDRMPRHSPGTFAAMSASNLPAALLNERGQPIAIR